MAVTSGICGFAAASVQLYAQMFWVSKPSEWQFHHKPFLWYPVYIGIVIAALGVVFAALAIIFAIEDRGN
jgi:hypothetical protein